MPNRAKPEQATKQASLYPRAKPPNPKPITIIGELQREKSAHPKRSSEVFRPSEPAMTSISAQSENAAGMALQIMEAIATFRRLG